MNETWYVMEDGTAGDPREVRPGKDGRLRHKDGRTVAYAPHGPRSRSVDPEKERRLAAERAAKKDPPPPPAKDDPPPAPPAKDMQPEPPEPAKPRKGYKTRETKAR